MSGVRSSCATSLVRRCSSRRSFSTDAIMLSKVSPRCAISSSPVRLLRASNLPAFTAAAVRVSRLIGATSARANATPNSVDTATAAMPENASAAYELSRNCWSSLLMSVSEPYIHMRTLPTTVPSEIMFASAICAGSVGSKVVPSGPSTLSPVVS